MRTRFGEEQAFDLGANFLIQDYPRVLALAEELQVQVENLSPVQHLVYRNGAFHTMNFSSARDIIRMDTLGLWSRIKFLEFGFQMRRKYDGLDFFDLSTVPAELNLEDAYSYAKREIGEEFADYILDGFHTCMMFYRASETSLSVFLSLFRKRADPSSDFSVLHTVGEMSALPESIAKNVSVRTDTAVNVLKCKDEGWVVGWPGGEEVFDRVVLATTASPARSLLPEALSGHRSLLAQTRFACTINCSFHVPYGILGRAHCFYVPFVESSLICEFTNEALKASARNKSGLALVNVGLHESAARSLWTSSDQSIFELVYHELVRLKPELKGAEPHDLMRWEEAMPKFDCQHLEEVRTFLTNDQGKEGLYLCGDYLNSPWLEGAARCGQRVAQAVLKGLKPV